ncbi:solute carrier family 15 member 1-like isoform X3 [Diabrotica virgifera virgifera]|uniref:Solute carrier family 15 member 2-like n=1 Tax=Diabrotica virgifera virgifera TaxID=50390 RepID=A0ABM5KW74_DIAVI|nr:solute carrier family 15 member 1-like isoform X3 [Diabrotica virgifera virgifera]
MNQEFAYPIAVFCIIATEFCERFAFSGLRTILSLYLRNILLFSENISTLIYHIFIMVCYIVPLAGAICADAYFGRYSTIRNFGIIYLIGHIVMFLAAVPIINLSPILYSAVGLTLIAIGTGGIKPCVAAFGAEQFSLPEQNKLLMHFFSIFYFTINLGGFVGMMVTPILKKVPCFGDDTCYALGFGFPAVLMILSIFLFVIGRNFYKLKAPKKKVTMEFLKCIWYAVGMKIRRKSSGHWIDIGKTEYSPQLIEDIKIVCRILLLFTPLPIFWSLFDQQGSRWTFQAAHMDGNILGTLISPDQMQVVNPAMVLIIIPILDRVFYPCLSKHSFLENPLHRMAVGGIIAGIAFLSAGILELVLETTYPDLPRDHEASVNVINTLPCTLKVMNPLNGVQMLGAGNIFRFKNMLSHNYTMYKLTVEAPLQCGNIRFNKHTFEISMLSIEYQIDSIFIGTNNKNEIQSFTADPVDFRKSLNGYPRLRYECQIGSSEEKLLEEKLFHLTLGGVYTLAVRQNDNKIDFVKLFTMSIPNTVNILWQLPQYFFISVAEIMFGVAGLEFSFTQAPKSMKTVTVAGWYLSVAVGNLIVIIITQINLFSSQAHEFFLFAILIVAVMMVFMEMASKYKFITIKESDTTIGTDGEKTALFNSNSTVIIISD